MGGASSKAASDARSWGGDFLEASADCSGLAALAAGWSRLLGGDAAGGGWLLAQAGPTISMGIPLDRDDRGELISPLADPGRLTFFGQARPGRWIHIPAWGIKELNEVMPSLSQVSHWLPGAWGGTKVLFASQCKD